ncbi:uncharacterized protein P884DRAFT_204246 [Thermothelomyces heterothallicus CBS 202.75]|uniref:uncharacterized protein n=1 Tax=Thermothelomyces heterothallicus CBS 202.75 TaxID=1149848 RepID=UPI0037448987
METTTTILPGIVLMNTTVSTVYPRLQTADRTRASLADLPLETVLQILDALFEPQQLIVIDIYGPKAKNDGVYDMEGKVSSQTKVILRPPPLHVTATACRLFQHMYRKSRQTAWGAHLYLRRPYHVSLERDIFHVRVHRETYYGEWDRAGNPHLDPLYMILDGIQNLATSVDYIFPGMSVFYFLHLNPLGKVLNVLVPVPDLEKNVDPACGELQLAPVLVPIEDRYRIQTSFWKGKETWWYFREESEDHMRQRFLRCRPRSEAQRQLWERTWRLCPAPELKAYLVDERRLNDAVVSGLKKRIRS